MDALVDTFGPEHLSPDPLEVVRPYAARDDIEVVGFLAAALAFGSARGAVRSVEDLLARVTQDGAVPPGAAIRAFDATPRAGRGASAQPSARSSARPLARPAASSSARSSADSRVHPIARPSADAERLNGWRHRWLGPADAAATLHILARMLREHGSVEAFFAAGDDGAPDIGPALSSFCARALALAPPGAPPRVAYWFSGPARGGSAKRLCLFLRWMCRRDRLDPGPWTAVSPARLVIPLDVHVARISRYVGLLRRRSANWLAAQEVTSNLRRFDAEDPVRYDYALCRLGILGTCPRRRQARKCDGCPLFEVCLL